MLIMAKRFSLASLKDFVKLIKAIHMTFISSSHKNSSICMNDVIENTFPSKHSTKVNAFYFIIIFLMGYMWTFIGIPYSCQDLSAHNETQLKSFAVFTDHKQKFSECPEFYISLLWHYAGRKKILFQFFYYCMKIQNSLMVLNSYLRRERSYSTW